MDRIWYFSGTGNSLATASALSERLGASLGSITAYLKDPYPLEDDLMGVVFPVHCTELPPLVEDFFRSVRFAKRPAYLFLVATCGSVAGDALAEAGQILAKRFYDPQAGFNVYLPDSSIIFKTPEKKKQKMLASFDGVMDEIADFVTKRRENDACLTRNPVWMLAKKAGWPVLEKLFHVKQRRVDEKICTGCGTCEAVCPVGAVKLQKGRPIFLDGCAGCFGCAQWCPVHAISLGRLTPDDRSAWHNTRVTAQQMKEKKTLA